MPDIQNIIQELENINLASYPYFQVQELIRSLGQASFFVFTLHKGKIITRARQGENYRLKEEISYPPKDNCTESQRANIPHKPMFYGTIIQENQPLEETRMIAASECCELLKGGIDTSGTCKITFGRWTVLKDIKLVVIIDEQNFNDISNNPLLSELKSSFDSMPGTEAEIENYKIILSYFSNEFSKEAIQHDYDYLISALFTEVITTELGYDGVMYPSVQIGGQLGFNVAIKPEIVDNNMKLDIVAESTLYKKKEKSLILVDNISDTTSWQYLDSSQAPIDVVYMELGISSLDELRN